MEQAVRPACDDASADNAREWIHPQPTKGAGEQQAHDHQHGHSRIGRDVDHGGAHVVVAIRRSVRVLVLFEDDGIILLADPHMRRERVRLGNFFNRFQIAALIVHREKLPGPVRAHGFNRRRLRG